MDDEFWRAQYETRKQLAEEKFQEGYRQGFQEGRQDILKDLVARCLLTREQVNALK